MYFDAFERYHLMFPRAFATVSPLLFALGLLALTLATVRQRGRPGFPQVAFAPGFAAAMLFATTGAFFMRMIPLGHFWQYGLSLPLPDMDQLVFGPDSRANPIFYSALIPAAVSFLGVRFAAARRAVQGLCIGFAGTMAAAAVHGTPALQVLTSGWVSVPWLAANAVVCCFLARAMFAARSE